MSKVEGLKEEIINYFNSDKAHGPNGWHSDLKVDVFVEDTTWKIHLQQMYEGLSSIASFKNLQWLATLLGTDKIDVGDQNYRSGCESCDYGSSDELTITCLEGPTE